MARTKTKPGPKPKYEAREFLNAAKCYQSDVKSFQLTGPGYSVSKWWTIRTSLPLA